MGKALGRKGATRYNPSMETNASENGTNTRQPVWSYKGYELRPSEFTTAMVHYYRAEIQRSNTWRTRLDATTNWAVITTGTAISFVLSNPANHHGVIILNILLITLFLWIEARRYRYYELWSLRTRHLETNFFAAMLVPPFAPQADFAESLAQSLIQPEFPISMLEAFGRRLRRNYIWIYIVLGFVWLLKLYIHPTIAVSLEEFFQRGAIGPVGGEIILGVGLFVTLAMILTALLTVRMTHATGEVLPKFSTEKHYPRTAPWIIPGVRGKREQFLVWIITDRPTEVAQKVMTQMKRGVTRLEGQGMYTGKERGVLMVALSVTEIAELKALVVQQDPAALVVVLPAQEIMGRNFKFNLR